MPPKRTRAAPATFTWQAQEVVQTVDHKPHLVVQISVTGGVFPQRALVPIMRIIQRDLLAVQRPGRQEFRLAHRLR